MTRDSGEKRSQSHPLQIQNVDDHHGDVLASDDETRETCHELPLNAHQTLPKAEMLTSQHWRYQRLKIRRKTVKPRSTARNRHPGFGETLDPILFDLAMKGKCPMEAHDAARAARCHYGRRDCVVASGVVDADHRTAVAGAVVDAILPNVVVAAGSHVLVLVLVLVHVLVDADDLDALAWAVPTVGQPIVHHAWVAVDQQFQNSVENVKNPLDGTQYFRNSSAG
eukprot:ANDGO_07957.mRNA.1 hypothetical protein